MLKWTLNYCVFVCVCVRACVEIKGIDKAASPVGVEQERETQEEPVPDKDPALDEAPSLEQVPVPGEEPITEVPTLEEVALAEKVPVPEEVPSQTQQQPVTFTSEPQGKSHAHLSLFQETKSC